MIIHESGNFGLKPLKEGANPTFLNDNEVSGGAALADGDLIRVGNTTLKFRVS
jgi:pSer/pThr/pTyr-binding forkhead associated (FHA) protein